jgi:hypothetical protein
MRNAHKILVLIHEGKVYLRDLEVDESNIRVGINLWCVCGLKSSGSAIKLLERWKAISRLADRPTVPQEQF